MDKLMQITLNGVTYQAYTQHDSESDYFDDEAGILKEMIKYPPHGYTREKRAGQIRQHDGRNSYLVDFKALADRALQEGWGVDASKMTAFDLRVVCHIPKGHDPKPFCDALTNRQRASLAAWQEVKRLRDYYHEFWWYVAVVVRAVDGAHKGQERALWRVESDSGDYIEQVAQELAEELDGELQEYLQKSGEKASAIDAMLNSATV